MGNASNAHPVYPLHEGNKIEDYPFVKLSWNLAEAGKITSRFEDKFPERKNLRFYSHDRPILNDDEIISIYSNFKNNTNFISLFAATNLWDDFAESFANYLHVNISKRPWQTVIEQKGRDEIIVKSCWNEKRCNNKEEYMKRWFENPMTAN